MAFYYRPDFRVKSKSEIREKRIRDIRFNNKAIDKEFVYNKKRFDFIMELDRQGKIYSCLKEINKYFQDYPYDPNTILLYSMIQKRVGNFGESRKFLEAAKGYPELQLNMPAQLASADISLLIRENRYEEALKLLNENEEILKERNGAVGLIRNYLHVQLGLEPNDTEFEDLYTNKQVINYSEELLFEHLQKHVYDNDTIIETETVFNPSIDIHNLLELVKEHIADIEPFHSSFFNEVVYMKYKNVGLCDGKNTHIMKVIFIRGTNDIITMYPCFNPDNYPVIDISPEFTFGRLRKSFTGLERWNHRYNRK